MSNFNHDREPIHQTNLGPELAELDRQMEAHSWRDRLHALGHLAYEGLQAAGYGLYPMMGYTVRQAHAEASPDKHPSDPF